MKKNIKRAFALMLTVIILVSMAACSNDKKPDPDNPGPSVSGDYYYELKALTLDGGVGYIEDMAVINDTPYLLAYDERSMGGIHRLDMESMSTEKIYAPESGAVILSLASDRRDGMWIIEATFSEEGELLKAILKHLDTKGSVTTSTEITDNCRYITGMASDSEGNLYVCDAWDKILLIDANGEFIGEADVSGSIVGIATTGDGRVAAYDAADRSLCVLDWDKKAYGDKIRSELSIYTMLDGDDAYDIYFYNDEGLYGFNSEDNSVDEVLTWLDCGITQAYYCGAVDNETFLVSDGSLNLLSRNEGVRSDNRTTINYATLGLHDIVQNAVVSFNRTNDKYKLEVIDYSEEGDENAGLLKLNTEIISGTTPDIIDLNGLPIQEYANKGLLADLGKLLEGEGDYSPNVLDALSIDGKMYSIFPAYTVSTVFGRASQVGSEMSWTFAEFSELSAAANGTAFANLTQAEAMTLLFDAVQGTFIDWDNRSCDFTQESFIQLLEMAAQYPPEITGEKSEIIQLADGTALLIVGEVKSDISFLLCEAMLGDDITFIGYPTPDGRGGNSIVPIAEMGIMAASENADGAWEFIRHVLTEEFQDKISYSFPVRQSSLEKMMVDFMTPDTYIDENGEERVITSEMSVDDGEGGDILFNLSALSEETVDKFRSLLESLDTVKRPERGISEIISEESAYYFSGDKTAGEVAQIIQNRISTYMSERK